MFDRFGVRQALAEWMDAATASKLFEQRGEHEQVWTELVALFEQMVDLLGDERLHQHRRVCDRARQLRRQRALYRSRPWHQLRLRKLLRRAEVQLCLQRWLYGRRCQV